MSRSLSIVIAASALTLAACETGRQQMPVGPDDGPGQASSALYIANTDHDALARVDPATNEVRSIHVGDEPTRIARVGSRVYVTLRGERALAVLEERSGRLAPIAKITVGTEPVGVVATATRIYVAASTADQVVEIDAGSLTITRRFDVPGGPRWLALNPNGTDLYAATGYNGTLAHIDLEDEAVVMHTLPALPNFAPLRNNQRPPEEPPMLTRRITGDITLTPDGGKLIIPALFIDNASTIHDNEGSGDGSTGRGSTGSNSTEPGAGRAPPPPNGDEEGFSMGGGSGYGEKFNPTVVIADIDTAGTPDTEGGAPVSVTAFGTQVINGYPSSATVDPDGRAVYVTIEGAGAVLALALPSGFADSGSGLSGGAGAAPVPGGGGPGFAFMPNVVLEAGDGVRSVVVHEAGVFAHAFFDNELVELPREDMRRALGLSASDETSGGRRAGPQSNVLTASRRLTIATRSVPEEVDRGRRLFFSNSDSRVAGNGAGVSCATCHFDSRTDGLTWQFTRGPRQTPSLAGNVSAHEPVGWQGDRPTVAEDAMLTSQGLMGGNGLTTTDTLDIQSFVNWTRDVDHPTKGSTEPAVMRGKTIFERSDTACAACHNGERHTNNLVVRLFLDDSKVRPLVGLSASAPYFHDGSAATLRDVLERARDGSMGNTGMLDDSEMSDLESYLRSL